LAPGAITENGKNDTTAALPDKRRFAWPITTEIIRQEKRNDVCA
jgi:hypothetical protein